MDACGRDYAIAFHSRWVDMGPEQHLCYILGDMATRRVRPEAEMGLPLTTVGRALTYMHGNPNRLTMGATRSAHTHTLW